MYELSENDELLIRREFCNNCNKNCENCEKLEAALKWVEQYKYRQMLVDSF